MGWSVKDGRAREPYAIVTRSEVGQVARAAGPTAALVWVCLLTYADHDTRSGCYPMQRTVSAELGVSRRTVRRAIDHLVAARFLKREWKPTPSGRRREYTLLTPPAE